jgi:hypothetical protein
VALIELCASPSDTIRNSKIGIFKCKVLSGKRSVHNTNNSIYPLAMAFFYDPIMRLFEKKNAIEEVLL